jgi:WD40 repeat protein
LRILVFLLSFILMRLNFSAAQDAAPELVIQKGHSSRVQGLAFSGDGRWLAAADLTGVHLWDVKYARDLRTFPALIPGPVAMSGDGGRLAVAEATGILVWDVAQARILKTFPTNQSRFVALSHDGHLLAWIQEGNPDIQLYNLVSDVNAQILTGHKRPPLSLAFSPDDSLLASASAEEVRIFDVAGHSLRQVIFGHTNQEPSIAFSHDGLWLATRVEGEDVRIIEVTSGQEVEHVPGHGDVTSLAFTKDEVLAVAHESEAIAVSFWNPKTREATLQKLGQSLIPLRPVLSSDAGLLVLAPHDPRTETLSIWDVPSNTRLPSLWASTSEILDMDVSPNGALLATVNQAGSLDVWDVDSGLPAMKLHPAATWSDTVEFSPRGDQTAVPGGNVLLLLDSRHGRILKKMQGHTDSIHAIAFRSDGKVIATGARDQTVRLWNAETGASIETLLGHSSGIDSVLFSPDGKWLVSASSNELKIWDAVSFKEQRTLKGSPTQRRGLAFSPDSRYFAAARSWDLILTEPATGNSRIIKQQFGGHDLRCLSFNAKGDVLAAGSTDGAILGVRSPGPALWTNGRPLARDVRQSLWQPPTKLRQGRR